MNKHELVRHWLDEGLEAVQPEVLTAQALHGRDGLERVIAIGKAAPGMCRGAFSAAGALSGLCITNHPSEVPSGIELVIGDHPVPGKRSLEAGLRALDFAPEASIALISGGGSALCEVPRDGLTISQLAAINRGLLAGGASIEETNLVRRHVSKLKGGGLGPIPTFILSDVAGADPGVVSSGPTIPAPSAPDEAIGVLEKYGIPVDHELEDAIGAGACERPMPDVTVVGDGQTAARAVAAAAASTATANALDGWITGDFESALVAFIEEAPTGVTVAAGEPSVVAHGDGRGGRNTHTALRAAELIAGSDAVFAGLATDGEDGNSRSAGAIVDGTTIERGGDPSAALLDCDSASYLGSLGELIETGPTGTNVADIWLIWKS